MRNNSSNDTGDYWYNMRKSWFKYDIDYLVCVTGVYGFYCIPFDIIKENALNGNFSATKDGTDYKVTLKRIDNQMHLHFIKNHLTGKRKAPLLLDEYFHSAKPSSIHETKVEFSDTFFPETADTDTCIEGAKTTVQLNKYERSSAARQKCIDANGCYCQICGLNFTQRYGEVGKDFIHVHHKVPLNQISEEYEVDPVNDLIPVCPNCHAMLYRKVNEKHLSIDELKAILKQ